MKTVRYIGPFEAVYIPAHDPDLDISPGDTVDVSDEIGDSLAEQIGAWELVESTPPPGSTKG